MDELSAGTPAAPEAPVIRDFSAYKRDANAKESTSTSAASSTASPAEPAASTDATLPPGSDPSTRPKKNADTRLPEVKASVAELQEQLRIQKALRAELDTLRTRPADVPQAASSPATSTPKLAEIIASPDITQSPLSDAKFFEAFPEATIGDLNRYMARYELKHEQAVTRQQETQRQHATTVETTRQTYLTRMAEAAKADPELSSRVDPRLAALVPIDGLPPGAHIRPENALMQDIVTSEHPAALFDYFSANEAEVLRLLALPTRFDLAREMGRIEARLSLGTTPTIAPKSVSDATAPPTTLGRKPAIPADDVEHAVKTRDFRRYREAQNARDVAARA